MSTTVPAPDVQRARPAPVLTPADRRMRKLLRLPETAPRASADAAHKAFRTSLLVSTVRCLLMYIVVPFVAPAIGLATGAAPVLGLVIGVAAIVCLYFSVRRFFAASHSKRWHYAALAGAVTVALLVMAVRDVVELVS